MRITKKWFTLIELLTAISIFMILVVMSYANYAYYQNIAKVKLSLKEISQSINTWKNMAINWKDDSTSLKNQSIWVYFESNTDEIKYYSFDYDLSWSLISLSWKTPFKTEKLQDKVKLNSIYSSGTQSDYKNVMIFFSAIYAKTEILKFSDTWFRQDLNIDNLNFKVSYKTYTNFPLSRELKYYKISVDL